MVGARQVRIDFYCRVCVGSSLVVVTVLAGSVMTRKMKRPQPRPIGGGSTGDIGSVGGASNIFSTYFAMGATTTSPAVATHSRNAGAPKKAKQPRRAAPTHSFSQIQGESHHHCRHCHHHHHHRH